MAEIFTLYQSVEGMELKKKKKYSCLVIALSLRDQMLLVSTQQQSLKGVCVGGGEGIITERWVGRGVLLKSG